MIIRTPSRGMVTLAENKFVLLSASIRVLPGTLKTVQNCEQSRLNNHARKQKDREVQVAQHIAYNRGVSGLVQAMLVAYLPQCC